MDISWESTQLIAQAHRLESLPEEILDILQNGANSEYLETLASLALRPAFTSAIFTIHEPIFVEVCGRWLARGGLDQLSALSALSRVVSLRPHLSKFANPILSGRRSAVLEAVASRKANALQDVTLEALHDYLLTMYRLLVFDNSGYAPFVSPAQMQSLLGHDSRSVRYLAIRILCLYLHASDAALVEMVKKYLGEDSVQGRWEGKSIDYTFLSLWEKKRLEELSRQIEDAEHARNVQREQKKSVKLRRVVQLQELSATSAYLGGVLVPQLTSSGLDNGSIVMTETTCTSLKGLAEGINSGKPLLVTGLGGSGKTSMIRHTARILGTDSSMVTLHLNEQTDAKLLIGMYTSSKTPGSFTWQPGVLAKAVRDGRWVLIEDLDRAPPDVLSNLLPLLERRELFIPNRGESIHAASEFKLIATVRSFENVRGEEIDPTANLVGRRLWSRVAIGSKSDVELAAIIKHKRPILYAHIPQMMAAYSTLRSTNFNAGSDVRLVTPIGPQELLRWSARVEGLLLAAGVTTGSEPISEATSDNIFLEAVDCFAAAIPSGPSKVQVLDVLAHQLQLPAKRVEYCLQTRVPARQESGSVFSIGRVKLPKKQASRADAAERMTAQGPFAITDHVSRILESVAATVKRAEPCLLVGETGTGKTTIVQRLASTLNQRLIVVNLSQQSEAGDLLGGFKPVNMRSLAIPMREEFDELLHLTFPSKTNQQYSTILEKAVAKARWPRALSLWQEALRSIQSHLNAVLTAPDTGSEEPRSKKRKVRTTTYQQLKSRWDKFAADVQTFKMQLASGNKGFAFSFIEGSIVKAARNGDWVLLDEINLASPDTLESLVDLFSSEEDASRSLLLSESGETERVQAHKDFRIFGAMNPATDAGKRDLPPNIRSRFSEFFVEAPDNDVNNLVPVIKAYLGNHAHVDVRLATDIAQLYLEIKNLAKENKLADGTDQSAHFSLRTLTRTLSYAIDIAPVYGLRRALFEGFCMSFLTSLNKESESLLQPLIDQHILGSQKNRRAIMHQTPRIPQDGKRYVQFRHYWISQGAITAEEQSHYIITPFIERNLLNLVRATSTRKFPVLLQGPTSSGKTSMIEHLAKISGNKFIRINNHEHTDLQEYLGSYGSGPDGSLQYQEGLLVQALKEGSWIVLDELNLAPTDVLEALNRLLDDNRELFLPETQQVVRPHERFMLFATQNPPGLYGGRKILSRAFRNRFLELHFDDIPEDELEIILRERSQIAPSFCTQIVSVYKRLSILRQTSRLFEQRNSFATLRDLFRWALRDADDREQLAVNGFFLLAERIRNAEERKAVKKVIEEVMKVKIDEKQIYGLKSLENSMASPLPAPQGITWTKSMRRLYILVSHALKNDEPVLLIGETGSGKTTICQAIAEIMHTKIHIVNAHQNMETGDLIGSQRPIRDKSSAQLQLSHDLITVLEGSGPYKAAPQDDLETLTKQYEMLLQEAPEKVSDEVRFEIERSFTKANALFEWSDGSLVQAMREGHHYLLDEISLADDSVLERLNSVLEPGRSLLLAEKGSIDAQVTASSEFQFLATMNPGGDYGKRELSPALRNRFTEIWVPNIIDEAEMLEIVTARLPSSRADLARPMVNFAAWNASTYHANAPIYSIRDLLAWAKFVDVFQGAEFSFSAFHGAAMVYLDGLGANPAAQTPLIHVNGLNGTHASLRKLSELFNCDMVSMYNVNPMLVLGRHQLQIGDFTLAKVSDEVLGLQYSLQAPTTKLNAMKLVRALQLRKPILLEGSPGVGKTTLVSALAHAVGMPLTRINLSDQTDLMDLLGSDVPIEGERAGHFGWRDAPFLRAMQNGEWVLLDEMNLASQTVLEGLNACLDHRGEVYISELDRTFTRHPNFAIFAAQNPHSQGGGRKGLPASFVNRFTIVYAEPFSPDDLKAICCELFPEVFNDVVDRLVRCITRLNVVLLMDPQLGAHGGPWEFNLRDILRWLKLLTSPNGYLLLANPADFADLLFMQRFRTPEDRAMISKVLNEALSQIEPRRNYYHAYDPYTLQVGFAILPRNKSSRPPLALERGTHNINLSTAESVMVCVEKSWPCLLVGASGSGKTATIQQLAISVGAELVNLSLNSEMDTLDLVGGFEQLDTEREIADFIKRVQAYSRRAIIQQIISGAKDNDNRLLELEKGLTTNLLDILRLLQFATQSYPSSDYADFLTECQSLMRQSAIDNRARFEWVDGILIKALKQGKWLILDNANLCNASVLDRLNSLLEPDGFLNINEHRSPDGSARVIKPHPDFRLFMTMDPRHGELSRAMRNRSVEIFMPSASPSPTLDVFGFDIESTVSRFQYSQVFDWVRCDDIQFINVMSIFLQHLTFSDFGLCGRWQAQMLLGLTNLPPSRFDLFHSVVSVYQDILASKYKIVQHIQESYLAICDELGHEQNLGGLQVSVRAFKRRNTCTDRLSSTMQTIHPFNNSVMLSALNSSSKQLQYLGHCFDLLIDLSFLRQKFVHVAHGISSKTAAQMTRLEKSLSINNAGALKYDTTQHIANFLRDMINHLRDVIACGDPVELASVQGFLKYAKEVMVYLVDLFELANSVSFDEGVFQTYQSLGWSLAASEVNTELMNNPQNILAKELASKLDALGIACEPHTGLAMRDLWAALKPPTAASMNQLEKCLGIEALADKFDTIKWRSGASLRELGLLRDSLVAIHASVNARDLSNNTALEDAKKALEDTERQSHLSNGDTAPYFRMQFEILAEIHFLDKDSGLMRGQNMLEMLSDKPAKASMVFGPFSPGWSSLSQVYGFTAGTNEGSNLASLRQTFATSVLHKLSNLKDVPLRSLSLLTHEIELLAQMTTRMCGIIGSDPMPHVYRKLQGLRLMVAQLFEPQRAAAKMQNYLPRVNDLYKRLSGLDDDEGNTSDERKCTLLKCSNSVLMTSQFTLASQCGNTMMQMAEEWIQFFAGLLLLYVPDRPFDPALHLFVERDRHKKRKIELQTKLDSLQDFEKAFSGQNSSYRIHLIQTELNSLGAAPKVPLIVRPTNSQINLLQGEFNNILKSIVLQLPNPYILEATASDAGMRQGLELLRMNIGNATSRLLGDFRAYEDITKPVIAMLKGLNIGLDFAMLAGTEKTTEEKAIVHVCNMTPFMGANPQSMLKLGFHELEIISTPGLDARPLFLECVALIRSVESDLVNRPMRTMLEIFHSFYQEWKDKLDQDQKENLARSSLYRYRGSEENNEEFDQEDFLQLFPAYDGHGDIDATTVKPTQNPKILAHRVSHLHREIFRTSGTAPGRILGMIENASDHIARLWLDNSKTSTSPVPAESMLSALILSLDKARDSLQSRNHQDKLYNFYTDANLVQSQKIVSLVQKIEARFYDLQEAWPEHATLEEVLRTSKELLWLRQSEPVAKILTKAEQLHRFIHEWQIVASREFTATSLYDQLTDLLVSWRRLELLTWARLLDMEDKHCKADSDSWWFVAYEVIIAAPMSIINGQESIGIYAQQLVETLENFLATTSIGQYAHRLGMIRCFEGHLALLVKEYESLNLVRNSLAAFLRYHHCFVDSIQQTLQTGRKQLERDMKEIVLLASWKDTNIVALRDSAKRSHHKLFKVVRKYRAMLARPAESVLRQGMPDPREETIAGLSTGLSALVAKVDPRVVDMCQRKLDGWSCKPARLRNPDETTQRMLGISRLPSGAIDGAACLETFASDLVESIKILQKETPTKATKENRETIKHVKSRKRKLYSETLKAVRQMGFRSNLSADVLKKQETLAAVLSSSCIFGKTAQADLAQADQYFDRLLNVMPQTRENAAKHSEDLSHAEVLRSIGYLESMLSTILKQREVLARSVDDLATFHKTCKKMKNLWAPEKQVIRKQDLVSERSEKGIRQVTQWLPNILDVGCTVLETHSKLDENDPPEALKCLRQWQMSFCESRNEILGLSELPIGVSSTGHMATFARQQLKVEAFEVLLQRLTTDYPNQAFIFKQIQLWTRSSKADMDQPAKSAQILTFSKFDESVSNAMNSILVALQHLSETLNSVPTTDDDTRWLFKVDTSLSNSLGSLHSQEIEQMLKLSMSQMRHLDIRGSDGFELASAICALAVPIVEQYQNIQKTALERYAKFHLSLCRLASILAKVLVQVAQEGFCSPSEDPTSNQDSNEKLEGGTGLGEGEGMEDISKDIEDDEDLSELTQQGKKVEEKQELEDQEDAVDMDHDEMEGEIGDKPDRSDGEDTFNGGDDNNLDDETGDVDELDPETVDEKLWDGKAGEKEKEKQGGYEKETADKDRARATETERTNSDDGDEHADEEQGEDQDTTQDDTDEGEEVAGEDNEKIDAHVQEGQNLDLPEEMDLDNADGSQGSQSEDDEIGKLSDVDALDETENKTEEMYDDEDASMLEEEEADKPGNEDGKKLEENEEEVNEGSKAGSPVDTLPDDEEIYQEDTDGLLPDRTDDVGSSTDNIAPKEAQGVGKDMDHTQADDQMQDNRARASKGAEGASDQQDDIKAVAQDGATSKTLAEGQGGRVEDENSPQNQSSQPFKRLGDVLEEWHKQQKQIQEASSPNRQRSPTAKNENPQNEEFEHLGHDEEEGDTQALGAASKEQARPLDDNAVDSEMQDEPRTFAPQNEDLEGATEEDQTMEDARDLEISSDHSRDKSRAGAFVGKDARSERQNHQPSVAERPDHTESMDKLDNNLSLTHLQPSQETFSKSMEEARRLWSHYEAITRELSLFLTERLRLILAPTLATKMRGDFRTGKRLNIKRIIPYIASNFKRDKIWMRRSIPSKRNYQIMLAVDDSRSMSESGSGQLAYQTLALVVKSLSMLEAGEICIVGFGNEVFVAHEFDAPFSSEAGATVLQRFSFLQDGTDVRKLVAESIKLFRRARFKQSGSGKDLWQLELIISDGVCEDHETIKRLVRQASEERIMLVFVIVDALLKEESIVDMNQAVFEPDDATGETRLKIKRYLDSFPFMYYIVVSDVRELPAVLAQALRQWFTEVAES